MRWKWPSRPRSEIIMRIAGPRGNTDDLNGRIGTVSGPTPLVLELFLTAKRSPSRAAGLEQRKLRSSPRSWFRTRCSTTGRGIGAGSLAPVSRAARGPRGVFKPSQGHAQIHSGTATAADLAPGWDCHRRTVNATHRPWRVFVPACLQLHRQRPAARLVVNINLNDVLLTALRQGDIDLSINALPAVMPDDLEAVPLLADDLCVVVRAAGGVAARRSALPAQDRRGHTARRRTGAAGAAFHGRAAGAGALTCGSVRGHSPGMHIAHCAWAATFLMRPSQARRLIVPATALEKGFARGRISQTSSSVKSPSGRPETDLRSQPLSLLSRPKLNSLAPISRVVRRRGPGSARKTASPYRARCRWSR